MRKCLLVASIALSLVLIASCKPLEKSVETNSSDLLSVDESKKAGLLEKTDNFIRGIEESGVKGIKSVLCSLGKENSALGSNVLKGINALVVQGSIDFASILAKGKSPVNVRGAVEVVYWFPEDDPQKIERHIHLIPSLGATSSPSGPLDFEVGVVYGCPQNDPGAYGGYFASIGAMGAQINLGADAGAVFERAFIAGLESSVPGGVNDNYAIDHEGVIKILNEAGERARKYASVRADGYKVAGDSFDKLMREVRVTLRHDENWNIEMDFLTKRGIKVINGMYKKSSSESDPVRLLKAGANLTMQSGESEQAYKLRVASRMGEYNDIVDYFWGNKNVESDLKKPNGLAQTMYSVSGQAHSENKTILKAALNPTVRGTDGRWLYSVTSDLIAEMKKTMLNDQTYGCKRQRERYPDSRFFRVYINKNPWIYDCIGFGPREKYQDGISSRLYSEDSFNRFILPEFKATKAFFDDLEQIRYASRNGIIQLHDAFNTNQSILSQSTGGIRPGRILTGCNSVTLDRHGLLNVGRLGIGALQSGASLLTKNISGGLRSAIKTVGHHASVSASLAHYYHIHAGHGEHHASAGWPIIRSVRALKSISCDVEGVPGLDPANDTGESSGH